MNKAFIISNLQKALARFPLVQHAYIAGSFGTPFMTRHSDVDLIVIWSNMPNTGTRDAFLKEVAAIFGSKPQWMFLDSDDGIARDALKLADLPKIEVYHNSIVGLEFTLKHLTEQEGLDYSLSQRTTLVMNDSIEAFIESYLDSYKPSAQDLYFDILTHRQTNSITDKTVEDIYRLYALATLSRVPAVKHWPKMLSQIPFNHLLSAGQTLEWLNQASEYLATWGGAIPTEQLSQNDLQLSKQNPEMAHKVFTTVVSQKKRLEEFLSWPKKINTIDDQLIFSRRAEQQWQTGQAFHLQLFHNLSFAGAISIHSINYQERSFEFGYWIDRSAEGKGLISRGLRLLMQDLKTKGWRKAKIRILNENVRSEKVAERLGMKHTTSSETQKIYSMNL